MTLDEVAQHVGDAVIYRPRPGDAGRPGVIKGVKSLAIVQFTDHDGGVLQVNPYCLQLRDEEPTLFGNIHEGM